MKRTCVYFAQNLDGGPIKIGTTGDIENRRVALSMGFYPGIEIITTIPGSVARESFLGCALLPWKTRGEWFKNCAPIWRALLEAHDTGDIAWLPAERAPFDWRATEQERGEARTEYRRLCQIGGYNRPVADTAHLSPVYFGRAQFHAALACNTLPEWLVEAHLINHGQVAS
jgi:hypothetical protein